jgi:hypothetical protein
MVLQFASGVRRKACGVRLKNYRIAKTFLFAEELDHLAPTGCKNIVFSPVTEESSLQRVWNTPLPAGRSKGLGYKAPEFRP